VYLFANGELEQMTDDHSLVAALVREGRLTPEEAEEHPQRNILTRALGIDHEVAVDAWEVAPFVGDRWVLCSDGLFNEVSVDQMSAVLRRLSDPNEAARELVRLANDSGGRDNITVLIVDVVEDPGHAEIAAAPAEVASNGGRVPAPADSVFEAPPPPPAVEPRRRARNRDRPRFTWRVGLFFLALLALVGVVIGAVSYYGTDDGPTLQDGPVPTTTSVVVTTTVTTLGTESTVTTIVPSTTPTTAATAPTTTAG
jgi:hypothetical protein